MTELAVRTWWFDLPESDGTIPVPINGRTLLLVFDSKRDLRKFSRELDAFLKEELGVIQR